MRKGLGAGLGVLLSFGLFGCAGAAAEGELAAAPVAPPCVAPLPESIPPAPAVADSFSIHQAEEEATRPAPRPARSISLGYAGDEPLAGGVMRDTPMDVDPNAPPGTRMTWQQYIRQPSWPPPREPAYARSPGYYPRYGRW